MSVPNNIQDHFLEMPQLENLNFLGTVGITTLGSQLCFVMLQKYNLGSGPVKEMQFPQSLRFFHIRRYVWTYVLLKNYFKLGLLSLEHTKGISMPDSVLLSFREKLQNLKNPSIFSFILSNYFCMSVLEVKRFIKDWLNASH